MSRWNPDSYLKYEYERTLPSRDLAARIEVPNPQKIIDIGCGPGNSTKVLSDRWPDADISGLDSSEEMIGKAKASDPSVNWILADAARWETGDRYDIIFSNATLQWIPGQDRLIRRLFRYVKTGGVLAVQVPLNNRSPLHRALLRVAERSEWKSLMIGCSSQITYHDESFYYNLLSPLSERIGMWLTTYLHILGSHQDLLDWYSSTGLKSYLSRLDREEDREAFKSQILAECRPKYPPRPDGRILFPFKRLFFTVCRQ